jgi:hypothetical protein
MRVTTLQRPRARMALNPIYKTKKFKVKPIEVQVN